MSLISTGSISLDSTFNVCLRLRISIDFMQIRVQHNLKANFSLHEKMSKMHAYKCYDMFSFQIKVIFLHLDPDPATQINADPWICNQFTDKFGLLQPLPSSLPPEREGNTL